MSPSRRRIVPWVLLMLGTVLCLKPAPSRSGEGIDEETARARLAEATAADPGSERWAGAALGVVDLLVRGAGDRLDEAESLARRAIAIREGVFGPDHPEVASALERLAMLRWLEGDAEAMRPVAERIVAIRERRPGDEAALARALHFLAEAHRAQGDPAGALAIRDRLDPILERVDRPGHDDRVAHLLAVAHLRDLTGDAGGAIEATRRAVELATEAASLRPAALSRALAHLGGRLLASGDPAAAEAPIERALSIQRHLPEPEQTLLAGTLTSLGGVRLEGGRPDVARRLYARAEAIERRRVGDDGVSVARILAAKGVLERRVGDLAASRRYLERALEIQAAAGAGEDLARTLLDIAGLEHDAGRVSAAVEACCRSVRLECGRFRRIANGLSERQALAMGRRSDAGLDAALAWSAEASRGGLLEEEAASSLLDARIRSRALVLDRLASRGRRPADEIGLEAVRAALPEGTAIVSYAAFEAVGGGYLAFVLCDRASAPAVVPLGDAETIERLVADWRESAGREPRLAGTERSEARFREASRRLAERIWDPVEPLVGVASTVLVVPARALHLVNFATLLRRDGRYLVETDAEVQVISAERDLLAWTSPAPAGRGFLALADPVVAEGLEPIPASRREAEEIAAGWPADERLVLTGSAATEEAFLARAPGVRVVHLATHALYEEGAPVPGANPLRRCGLLLAGGGFLTAEEIAGTNLDGVEWAVLSGCDTGGGALDPREGILGLGRAFRIAGARSLILSLWPVEDEATRHWMRALYAARAGGASTAGSVRQASREILAEQRRRVGSTHPYHWGSFVAVGDWR